VLGFGKVDGLKRERRKGREGKGFSKILKRTQAKEFKLESEFQQSKAMHQHECNN
jgi:hypothetical protein